MSRTAVILLNLGGPDSQQAVKPFLRNMFMDRAILRVPFLVRVFLAWLISTRRAPVARAIYAQLGGGSPILPQTKAQADALQAALGPDYKVFIAMRYWRPRAAHTVREVKEYNPDRIVLLPLYPQFSTATTASSLAEWRKEAGKAALGVQTQAICCYPTAPGFAGAYANLIRERWQPGFRLLFSAHGLPEKIIQAGDPYQRQVEQSVRAIVAALNIPGLDYRVCYQSRVGPLKWIGPPTEEEIRRAGAENVNVMVVPVAFVSEHSETLVELDIEYAHLAHECGVKDYRRVPALGTHPAFIAGLAALAHDPAPYANCAWPNCSCQRLV